MQQRVPPKELERIKAGLLTTLSSLSCVRRIDSFGSIAVGRADEWSDLDLLVACEAPERAAWLAAGAVRAAHRVAFYRMFSNVAQPSGRYWFESESPFHRLDISFHSPAEHAAVCGSCVREGHPITIRTEYVTTRPVDFEADAKAVAAALPIDVTAEESEAGRLLYLHLEAAKGWLRGRPTKRSVAKTRASLFEAIHRLSTPAGGRAISGFAARADASICRLTNGAGRPIPGASG